MTLSRRSFLKMAFLAMVAPGTLTACAKKTVRAGLVPPDQIENDPRNTLPIPEEYAGKFYDARQTPYACGPLWATDDDKTVLRDEKNRPLIEGFVHPPTRNSNNEMFLTYEVFIVPVCKDDLQLARRALIFEDEKAARAAAKKLREIIRADQKAKEEKRLQEEATRQAKIEAAEKAKSEAHKRLEETCAKIDKEIKTLGEFTRPLKRPALCDGFNVQPQ